MLRTTSALQNYVLRASDGEIGRCKDFLFDDQSWCIRYMVADTRKWLPGRKVLISPISLGKPDWEQRRFAVNLTQDQIKNSPPLDEAAPVSRREERRWALHYGYGVYWSGAHLWGAVPYPHELRGRDADSDEGSTDGDRVHIRSCREVRGYHVHAIDGQLGHVLGFAIEDGSWRIRHLICELPETQGGKRQTQVAPDHVTRVDWLNRTVNLDLSRQALQADARAQSHA